MIITSKYIIELSEIYIDSKKTASGYTKFFANPTKSDIVEMTELAFEDKKRVLEEIRFVAVAKSPPVVYVWDAFYIPHRDARKILGLPTPDYSVPYIINGHAKLQNGKIVSDGSDIIDIASITLTYKGKNWKEYQEFLRSVFSYKWDWLDTYIGGWSEYIESREKKYEDAIKQ